MHLLLSSSYLRDRFATGACSFVSRLRRGLAAQTAENTLAVYHPTAIYYRINSPKPQTGKNYRK
eukprot:5527308-Amphidinium_carterae.1